MAAAQRIKFDTPHAGLASAPFPLAYLRLTCAAKQTVTPVLPHSNAVYGIISVHKKLSRNVNCREHGRSVREINMLTIPRTSGIYQILCVPTGKVYIGSAVDLWNRWRQHRGDLQRNKHPNSYLQHAWNKHGAAAFQFQVLLFCSATELIAQEQQKIDALKATDDRHGFNLAPTAGSHLGIKRSIETRAKLSSVRRQIMSSSAARAAVSRVHKGKTMSDEARARMSAAHMGQKKSAESIAKTVAAHVKPYIVTEPGGNSYRIANLKQFCRDHGLCYVGAKRVLSEKRQTYKGWVFRHAEY